MSSSLDEAWEILTDKNPLPCVQGRICPHPCETSCNRAQKADGAVAIADDLAREVSSPPELLRVATIAEQIAQLASLDVLDAAHRRVLGEGWEFLQRLGNRLRIVEQIKRTLAANSMYDGVHIRLMITRGVKSTPYQDPRFTITPPTIVAPASERTADR